MNIDILFFYFYRFNISFEFRSFHQNGAIFLIGDPTDFGGDYVAGQLSDGIFMVYFKYDGTLYSVNSTAQTTNGQWHTVQVLKGTKNIRIQVDGNTKKEPIKRKLNIDAPVFVGGVKFDLSKRPELVQHSIRGCLRNFYINNQIILIKDAEIVKGVTKCYVNVEPGVYFPGSGYGIIGMYLSMVVVLISVHCSLNNNYGNIMSGIIMTWHGLYLTNQQNKSCAKQPLIKFVTNELSCNNCLVVYNTTDIQYFIHLSRYIVCTVISCFANTSFLSVFLVYEKLQ